MAQLYADEDVDERVIEELRRLGHDLLTARDAGMANQGIDDPDQLAHAVALGRAFLTCNRPDFIKLHKSGRAHHGIIVCTRDESLALAARIDHAIQAHSPIDNKLLRVNRPSK